MPLRPALVLWNSVYKPLISPMLGHPPEPPSYIPECVSAVAASVGRPDWLSLGDMDVPITQHCIG